MGRTKQVSPPGPNWAALKALEVIEEARPAKQQELAHKALDKIHPDTPMHFIYRLFNLAFPDANLRSLEVFCSRFSTFDEITLGKGGLGEFEGNTLTRTPSYSVNHISELPDEAAATLFDAVFDRDFGAPLESNPVLYMYERAVLEGDLEVVVNAAGPTLFKRKRLLLLFLACKHPNVEFNEYFNLAWSDGTPPHALLSSEDWHLDRSTWAKLTQFNFPGLNMDEAEAILLSSARVSKTRALTDISLQLGYAKNRAKCTLLFDAYRGDAITIEKVEEMLVDESEEVRGRLLKTMQWAAQAIDEHDRLELAMKVESTKRARLE